ncbi:MAG: hypothetical protein EPO24_14290 [Bacteroidetes bacterium]|nr:MAG: hypothetical protein EPO24_14290 [Bacteroidota bacterium]
MRLIIYPLFVLMLCFGIVLLTGCETDDEAPVVNILLPSEEAMSLTAQGWSAFEQKNYTGALSLFMQAKEKNNLYADAYHGLAWTYARLDSLQEAKRYFDIVFGLNPAPIIDAFAGRSFVSLALGEYDDAIFAVQQVQNSNIVFYSFRHDANISIKDLWLVKAQSHFMLGEYNAARLLINQLDPENTLDPGSRTYIADLAAEIELLWNTI